MKKLKISPIIKNHKLLNADLYTKTRRSVSFKSVNNDMGVKEKTREILGEDYDMVVANDTCITSFGVQLLEKMNKDVLKRTYSEYSKCDIEGILNTGEDDFLQRAENIRFLNYLDETQKQNGESLLTSFSSNRFSQILFASPLNVDIRINIADRMKKTKAPLRAGFSHIFTDLISISAYDFFSKLNDDVISSVLNNDNKKAYSFFPKMLGLTEPKFCKVNYKKLDANATFVNSFANKKFSDGSSLIDCLSDFDFLLNPDLDTKKISGVLENILASVKNSDYVNKQSLQGFFNHIFNGDEEFLLQVEGFLNELKQQGVSIERINDLPILFDVASDIGVEKSISVYSKYAKLKDSNEKYIFENSNSSSIPKQTLLYLNKVSSNDEDVQNIDKLIKLIQSGYVDKHIFAYLPEEGSLNSLIVSDVNLLSGALERGTPLIDVIAPVVNSEEEGLSKVKVGDAFQLVHENFIRIKLNDSSSSLMKINRETYNELFPLVERFASTQNKIGNCWELTGFNSVFNDPRERFVIVSLFSNEIDENGKISKDVKVEFPNSKHEGYIFENGEFPTSLNTDYYSSGSKGMRMLELAHSETIQYQDIDKVIERYNELVEEAADEDKKDTKSAKLDAIMQKVVARENRKSYMFWVDPVTNMPSVIKMSPDLPFDNVYEEKRNGGSPADLYLSLGYENVDKIDVLSSTYSDFMSVISNPETYEKNVLCFGTKNVRGCGHDVAIDEAKGIVMNHAYRLSMGEVENGKVKTLKILNPWGVSNVEIYPYELFSCANRIFIAERKNLNN